jgi:cyanophycinase
MIAFEGGGPFTDHDELDARLLAKCAASTVAVLPTADAMETPQLLIDAAEQWARRIGGISIVPAMVLQRSEATVEAANVIAGADAVWVVGDSSLHLRSVVKETPVMDALRAKADSGLLVGVGNSAAALCDPMTDPRGGAYTLGLGVITRLALITEVETWSPEQLQRSRELAEEHGDAALALLPTTAALLFDGSSVETVGDVEVVGALPAA